MKITDKRTDPHVFFSTLKEGDLFLFGEKIFMKISPATLDGGYINAISLETTKHSYFMSDESVNTVNAELVLKD